MTEHFKEIVVPVDGSENAVRAVRYAIELARPLNIGVRLFYVFPAASVEIIGMAGMSRADIDQAAQASAQRAFDKTREALGDDGGVKLEEETSMGDPAEEIIRYTEDDNAVLVVIGRRGLSRMKSLMLGSVSDKVMRHARSPVMVVT
ncbi:universal stress protein [Wenzhouxiangella marina]|uniref:UspA domain protein n=1 Tax=Wenzhouxiangella marina TaxID=1579979 RepID=A0A0K0XWM3_9GAMM|nr:universal stress protein [Wenzhouxiangella marina]AKS42016.1 UspA domain protein [Wenzhouxiangella marina]MBB6086216.1 nucleotide-binding universal stress UspA family protein [Wenzhouxiangella marina]